jgi:uncharacterized protein (UPF0332 family)
VLVSEATEPYATKSFESLNGARSEAVNRRFNNAASRAYFAAYQAAIVALIRAGINRPTWTHEEVQALFAGQLIGRRKLYPGEYRRLLSDLSSMRVRADYAKVAVSRSAAEGAVSDAARFVRRVIG